MRKKIKGAFAIGIALSACLNISPLAAETAADKDKKSDVVKEYEEETLLDMMRVLLIPERTILKLYMGDGIEFIDNYYFADEEDEDKESRYSNVLSSSVYLKYPTRRSYAEVRYDYDFTYYVTDVERAHRHNARVLLYHKPTRRLSYGVSNTFNRSDYSVENTDIDIPVGGRTILSNSLRNEVVYELTRRLLWRNAFHYDILDFREEAEGAGGDNKSILCGSGIDFIVDPLTTIGGGYSYRKTWFETFEKKSSKTNNTRLRLNRKVQKAFDVTVGGGYDFLHYDTGNEIAGFTADANLNILISKFTKLNFGYTYGFTDSVKSDYLVYRGHGVKASMNHNLTPRISMGADANYLLAYYDRDYRFKGSGESDSDDDMASNKNTKTFGVKASLDYKISRLLNVGFSYDGNFKFSDFERDQYYASRYYIYAKAEF